MSTNAFILVAALFVVFYSCHKDDSPSPPHASLTVRFKDASDHYDAVYLNIQKIWTRTSSGSGTLQSTTEPLNISSIKKDTVIAQGNVPTGKVQEIILELANEGNEVWTAGTRHPLKIDKDKYIDVKMAIDAEISISQINTLFLDFDVLKSIARTTDGQFVLNPVVEGVLMRNANGAISHTYDEE